MDDMNEIFSRATDADLDVELAAAGELLQKIAEQEGIDLSQLSDEDVAELMADLLPKTAADEGEHESAREESSENPKKKKKEEAKMASDVTFADVAVELNKVAANEGIDLDSLDRAQYHELFDIVAESMQDPEYMENKLAEDEANAKLAEADALGRYMARAFMDEQEKIAESAAQKRKRMGYVEPATSATTKGAPLAGDRLENAKRKAEALRKQRAAAPDSGLTGKSVGLGKTQRVLTGNQKREAAKAFAEREAKRQSNVEGARAFLRENVVDRAHRAATTLGHALGQGNVQKARRLGYGAAGTAAAIPLVAYGAKKLYDSQKTSALEALEDQALVTAEQLLLDEGYDFEPTKVAAESFDYDLDPELVEERAIQLLEENGYL